MPEVYLKKVFEMSTRRINNDLHRRYALIFLHIPKNAGTSLRKIIERFYEQEDIYLIYTKAYNLPDKSDFNALTDDEKRKIKVFMGHVSFGLHNNIPQPCLYATILRDPVERIISLFSHVSNDPSLPYYRRIKAEHMGIGEFVRSGLAFEADNHQTRVLSGIHAEFGNCTTEMLETAKNNLKEYFVVVGLTEYFVDSVFLMKKALGWKTPFYHSIFKILFGWKNPFYERSNVSVDRPRKDSLSKDDLNAIINFNKFDMDLYNYAKGLFLDQINKYGLSLHGQNKEGN